MFAATMHVVLFCILLIFGAHGHPEGAGEAACYGSAMDPTGHHPENVKGNITPPFGIEFSEEHYEPNMNVTGEVDIK